MEIARAVVSGLTQRSPSVRMVARVPPEELDDPGLAGRDHLHAGHAEERAEQQQDAGDDRRRGGVVVAAGAEDPADADHGDAQRDPEHGQQQGDPARDAVRRDLADLRAGHLGSVDGELAVGAGGLADRGVIGHENPRFSRCGT